MGECVLSIIDGDVDRWWDRGSAALAPFVFEEEK